MWYLILPDLLVYFTIFFGGVLTGILSVVMVILLYCRDGGTIKIQYSETNNLDTEDY